MALSLEIRPIISESGVITDIYDVYFNDQHLCRSREPLLAGSRKLLEMGHSPGLVVEVRRSGQVGWSVRSKLGYAAKLTVREDGRDGPRFTPYVPYPSRSGQPPSGNSELGATGQPSEQNNRSTVATASQGGGACDD